MNLESYIREIKLMKKQNNTEYDMYSIIASLIRDGKNVENLSIRDVNRRRKSEKGQVFYGLSSVPDFVILDLEFDNNKNKGMKIDNIDEIYGCVEIKGVEYDLLSIKDILGKLNIKNKMGELNSENKIKLGIEEGQLLGEILWYRKLIFTNGIRWKYCEWENIDKENWKLVKNIVKTRIDMEKEYKNKKNVDSGSCGNLSNYLWYNNIDFRNIKIKEIELINVSNEIKEEQWSEFLNKLHNIKWNKKQVDLYNLV